MIIVLLGPPGAGKGTQAKFICKLYNLFHFSTGNILREEVNKKTLVGKKIESIINAGKLISDEIIIEIVESIISKKLLKNKGILLDGFPRNIDQAKALDDLLLKKKNNLDCILHLSISKDEVIKRIEKRKTEENRKDDTIEILNSRFEVYLNETKPLLSLYKTNKKLFNVNGVQPINKVNDDINKIINNI